MSGIVLAVLAATSCMVPPLVLTSPRASGQGRRTPSRRRVTHVPPLVRAVRERAEGRELAEECMALMPTLIDVVTLGLSAGLSFDAALDLYCTRFDNALAREFSRAMLSWQMGVEDRRGALSSMADRLGSPAIRRFSDAVTEALAFGTPLAVEEQIEKAPVKMLIPLGTLIVPAMLLAILGPLLSTAMGIG